jgi:hypothetical protein
MITVIDEFVPLEFQQALIDAMDSKLTWKFKDKTALGVQGQNVLEDANTQDSSQFYHIAFDHLSGYKSMFFIFLKPLMDAIEKEFGAIGMLQRIKINHTSIIANRKELSYNLAHTDDGNIAWTTAVYYINNSDGPTYIFNEIYSEDSSITSLSIKEAVVPKQGRIVVFPSNLFHAGSNPIISNDRFVINIIFALGKDIPK